MKTPTKPIDHEKLCKLIELKKKECLDKLDKIFDS